MKGTDHFKRTIQMYLEQRAAEDELFAKNYRNPAKNIDDCITYILNYVQKSGCNGFSDGEIYGQAVHYYDENEIEVGKPPAMSDSREPCGGTHRRGEGGSTSASHPPIPRRGTAQDAEPTESKGSQATETPS
mgnify:CR=1 FL=1